MAFGSILFLIFIGAVALVTLFPQIFYWDAFEFLARLTGTVFAGTIVLGFVAVILSIILFLLSFGNLRMTHRSFFWLKFAIMVVTVGGFIWAMFQLIQQIA